MVLKHLVAEALPQNLSGKELFCQTHGRDFVRAQAPQNLPQHHRRIIIADRKRMAFIQLLLGDLYFNFQHAILQCHFAIQILLLC